MPSASAVDVDRDGTGSGASGARPVDVLISFADADRDHLDALVTHCALLERSGVLRLWHRERIGWGQEIAVADEKLDTADVIVLLVSASYHQEPWRWPGRRSRWRTGAGTPFCEWPSARCWRTPCTRPARSRRRAVSSRRRRPSRRSGSRSTRSFSLQGFKYGDLLLGQGATEEVLERAQYALTIASRNGWLLDIALGHLSLGCAHLLLALRGSPPADLGPARAELDHAVTGLRHAGQQHYLPLGLLARADLHLAAHDLPAAARDLDEALSLATRCGMRLHEADAHLGFTRLHLARPDLSAARTSLSAARTLITQTGYHRRDPDLAALEAALARATSTSPAPSSA